MKKIEILAPVGNKECLFAAIEAGCDAVYLGGHQFGARNFAGNFSNLELEEAVNYAHLYGVKVYVTVNTLIYENETEAFALYMDFLVSINVDAVIIQDIGMLDLVHQTYPSLEIHASTQMHIHNSEDVKIARLLGCTRVVLAREVDIDTVKAIKKSTNCEIEIFAHGALCISYSGLCLMSSLIGGRSGNRGTCAGSCRQKYKLARRVDNTFVDITDYEYLLSTKDLNTLNKVAELIEAGVDSLKIEGRMKRPSYVYAVVSLYRKAVDSYYKDKTVTITDTEIYELKKIFNRGYTEGFLFNEENKNITNSFRPNHMGVEIGKVIKVDSLNTTIELTDDVNIHDGIRIIGDPDIGLNLNVFRINGEIVKKAKSKDVITLTLPAPVRVDSVVVKSTDVLQLDKIDSIINSHNRKVSIEGKISLKLNEPVKLTLSDGVNEVTSISDEVVSMASNKPISMSEVVLKVSKLGNTVYNLANLDIDMDETVFIPIKVLNELRRAATLQLDKKRLQRPEKKKAIYRREVPTIEACEDMTVSVMNIYQYNQIKDSDVKTIYVTDNIYEEVMNDDRVVLQLPRVINTYKDYLNKVLITNIGSVITYKNVYTDTALNVTNSYTVALLHALGVARITLSYELDINQIDELLIAYNKRYHHKPNVELVIYGCEEIMTSLFLLPKKYNIKDEMVYLVDRFSNYYPIIIKDNLMTIYNHKGRVLEDKFLYYKLGINSLRVKILKNSELEYVLNNLL